MSRRIVFTAVTVLVLMLPFQNCTLSEDSSGKSQNKTVALHLENSSGGNGEYYGGKLRPGTYVRSVPDTKCGTTAKVGQIVVAATGDTTGSFTDPNTCDVTRRNLSVTELEYASYEPNRVGLSEGIYSFQPPTTPPAGTQGLVDEAWCRAEGSTTTTGFDIIVRADYKTNVFTTLIVAAKYVNGTLQRKEYDPRTPRREIEDARRVRYRGTDDTFELDIDTRTYNPQTGLMRSEFEFEMDGSETVINLYCRIGGQLDILSLTRPYD